MSAVMLQQERATHIPCACRFLNFFERTTLAWGWPLMRNLVRSQRLDS